MSGDARQLQDNSNGVQIAVTTQSGINVETVRLSTPTNHHIIRSLIAHLRPTRTLEIGLAFGGSAVEFLKAGVHHTAMDPMQADVWHNEGLLAVQRLAATDRFTFYEEGSETVLPRLQAAGAKFDLIYVDGAHTFEYVIRDALYSVELLSVGGVILFDDCTIPDVRKALRFLRNFDGIIKELDLAPFRPRRSVARLIGNALGYVQARAFTRLREGRRAWDAAFRNF